MMTFKASWLTVETPLFLEIPKRFSCSSTHTYILLSGHSPIPVPQTTRPLKPKLVSVGFKAERLGLEVCRWESFYSWLCSKQLFICPVLSSPHFKNSKTNICSIYFSCLFEKMKWVNKCESILRELKMLDSSMRFVILSEHDANLYYETSI